MESTFASSSLTVGVMGNAIPVRLSRRDGVVFGRDYPDNGRLSLKRIRNIEQSSEDLLGFSVTSGVGGERGVAEPEEEQGEERAVGVGVDEEEDVILGLELHVDCVRWCGRVFLGGR